MTDHGFEVSECVHRDLFGQCGNRELGMHHACDGKRHVGYDEETDDLKGDEIYDGDCCAYFDGTLNARGEI